MKVVVLNRDDESSEYKKTFSFKTPTKNDGGTDVSWDRNKGSFRLSEKEIRADTLVAFKVYDADLLTKEFIGETAPLTISE